MVPIIVTGNLPSGFIVFLRNGPPDTDLVTSRLVDPRRSRPRLPMLAFRGLRTLKLA